MSVYGNKREETREETRDKREETREEIRGKGGEEGENNNKRKVQSRLT